MREGLPEGQMGVWDGHTHNAALKRDNQQGPAVYTGKSGQYYVRT